MNVILHLGLGSFHRAHLAVYLHELIQSGDTGWQLAGGNTRPDMAETIARIGKEVTGRYADVTASVSNFVPELKV